MGIKLGMVNKQVQAPVSLCLFFTYGISLKKWDELGLFDREVILYKNLVAQGVKVSFFTYGDKQDLSYSARLPGINIIPAYAEIKKPKNNKLAFLQSLLFAFRFRKLYAQYDIYKTNQMFGAWVPLLAKFSNRKKLLARCGYEHYFTLITEKRSFTEKLFFYLFSKLVYFFSDHIIVTSEWISQYVSRKFFVFKNKISVLPNHVDVELFKDNSLASLNDRILFIGRLNREKNLFSLIEACKRVGIGLDLVGQGNLQAELMERVNTLGADVRFLGVLPNNELPLIIAQYPIFILPSFYEGNPKVLLEAMSCGKAVIGSRVDGISNIIKDGENGVLCGLSVDEIVRAILMVRNNASLQKKLGENARQYILENHSTANILSKELKIYGKLINKDIINGLPKAKVCLFFTYGISLKKWDDLGLLDREIILYKALVRSGMEVAFFTYGGNEDYAYEAQLPGIKIIPAYAKLKKPNNRKLAFLQSLFFPFIFKGLFSQYDIFKTNQMFGGWVPLIAKWLLRKRLLVRCGYEHYYFIIAADRSRIEKTLFYIFSKIVYFFSNHIIVTSEWIAMYVSRKFFVFRRKISVLPNLIDTELFIDSEFAPTLERIIFIGRLNKQKNLFALIEASKKAKIGIDLIGEGDLRAELIAFAEGIKADARFLGVFPNRELPVLMGQYPIFILPSFYEGNPKVLLEAMSCGKAVIGANVDGIKNIIKDGENGVLCGTNSDQIAAAIHKIKNNIELQKNLGKKARLYILENHSAKRILSQELSLYSEILT